MTDTATPRNEAAERLLTNISAQLTRNSDYIRLRDLLDSALAHERQQGREEAVRDAKLVLSAKPWMEDVIGRFKALLDAIASPSEPQGEIKRGSPEWNRVMEPAASPSEEPKEPHPTAHWDEPR